MISRVADHCFWFGRYLERAESTARVLAVTTTLALDAELAPRQLWLPLVIVSGEEERFRERFGEDAQGDGEIVQRYVAWDEENGASLLRSIGGARWNARQIREVVSLEAVALLASALAHQGRALEAVRVAEESQARTLRDQQAIAVAEKDVLAWAAVFERG